MDSNKLRAILINGETIQVVDMNKNKDRISKVLKTTNYKKIKRYIGNKNTKKEYFLLYNEELNNKTNSNLMNATAIKKNQSFIEELYIGNVLICNIGYNDHLWSLEDSDLIKIAGKVVKMDFDSNCSYKGRYLNEKCKTLILSEQ